MATRIRIQPEPEFISREDEEHGRWVVHECAPERGLPMTSITTREMFVPFDNDEVARCIRAHEVMHSKVSPGTNWPKWIERKWATERSMRVVEEARVNSLCERVGISVKAHLMDGKERAGAERIAQLGHWDDAVYGFVAMIGTAAESSYLKGIKKHQPEWVDPLKAISSKIMGDLNKISLKQLASTDFIQHWSDLSPAGFAHTERIAAWLDGIASLDPEDAEAAGSSPTSKGKPAPVSAKEIRKSSASIREPGEHLEAPMNGAWGVLNTAVADLTKSLPGSLARKRKASQVGRNPRRIHRLLTDPERRIFDTKSRGKGGVVLIDGSGSMSFSEEDILRIMTLAPGALVAVYAEDGDGSSGNPNLHVIAKNGKTVNEIPDRMCGNNVDLPALEWAVARRTSNKTPVIWVSDGAVTGIDGDCYVSLSMQCIAYCKKERVIVANHISDAISILSDLKSGRRPRWDWPGHLCKHFRDATGKPLISDSPLHITRGDYEEPY